MKIQLNSDKNVVLGTELSNTLKADLRQTPGRFEGQLTRLEVHLSDLNAAKPGLRDKRCMLEARPAGKKPVSTQFAAATVEDSVKGAAGKMKRLLETSSGKASHQTSRRLVGARKQKPVSARTLQALTRLEASLSQISSDAGETTPQIQKHVASAAQALRRARALAESAGEPEEVSRPVKRTGVERAAPNGRSPKKKRVYRARRKAWPKR